MRDWVKHALTRTVARKGSRGKPVVIVVEPNGKLVLLVKFAMGMTLCLSGLEIASLAFLAAWNSEVFSAIMFLMGAVSGVLIGHRGS
jgi:hypothetical protein